MGRPRIAVAQIGAELGQSAANTERVLRAVHEAARADAQLVVFPECVLTGYMFDSRADGVAAALSLHGEEVAAIGALCGELDVHVVVGLLEHDGDALYNTAALVGPG